MKKVHYIAYYQTPDEKRNLYTFPSGLSKMEYVIETVKRAGYNIDIFSTAHNMNHTYSYYNRIEKKIDDLETVLYISTFSAPFKVAKKINILWMFIQLIIYLMTKVKNGEKILVYHSNAYQVPLKIVKFFKKIEIIFEVEEIYSAVEKKSKKEIDDEVSFLVKHGSSFIFVNDIMASKFRIGTKDSIVLYGNYKMKKTKQVFGKEKHSKYINAVYAGIIGGANSDVDLAVKSALHLPNEYRMNILGYGKPENISLLNTAIDEVNSKAKREVVKYHGCLSGEAYSAFLNNMNIGVNTRVLDNHLSDYTFPSKLLVYLNHNLRIVSSSIDCVKKSKISKVISFFDPITPELVAQSIIEASNKNLAEENIIDELDCDFLEGLKRLLK